MTLEAIAPLIDYVENGSTLTHPVPFQFQASSEIVCSRIRFGETIPQTLGSDFTVSGGNGGTGTVTKTNGGIAGTIFRIERATTREQPLDLIAGDVFPVETVEKAFDRIAAVNQEQDQDLDEQAALVAQVQAALAGKADLSAIQVLISALGSSTSVIAALTPEQFGAKGDKDTNDTLAFQRLGAVVSAAGGGVVVEFRPGAIYTVGKQDFVNDGNFMWKPQSIFNITGCTRPVIIRANGATMRYADDLKFGTFGADGNETTHAMPYTTPGERCSPALDDEGMITFTGNSAPVAILGGIEFDGNIDNLNLGGPYGDSGWQLAGDGLLSFDNTGGEYFEGLISHHCPRDGGQFWQTMATEGAEQPMKVIAKSDFYYNSRQGVSLIDGRNYAFLECRFRLTGRGRILSAPTAGVDLEPNNFIRDVLFDHCDFIANGGAGMVSDGRDTRRITFRKCRFVGDINWTIYLTIPGFAFEDCTFYGGAQLSNAIASDPTLATRFKNCTFSDNAAETEFATLALNPGGLSLASVQTGGGGMLFDTCRFDGGRIGGGPALEGVTLRNCSITQSAAHGYDLSNARFEGRNLIDSPGWDYSNMPGAVFTGSLKLTGVEQFIATATYDPPSLAAGAKDTIHTMTVPGAIAGDFVEVSFSNDLAGARIVAWVSAASTVSYYAINENGANPLDLASGTLTARTRRAVQ